MPKVIESTSFEDYQTQVNGFIQRMTDNGHGGQAQMAEEMSKGEAGILRYVGYSDSHTLAGCMVLSTHPDALKIETISVDPNKDVGKGVATALVEAAVNKSFQIGKGGTLTLTNISKGTGDRFYEYMGFTCVEGSKMRMTLAASQRWVWQDTGPVRIPKRANEALRGTKLAFQPRT